LYNIKPVVVLAVVLIIFAPLLPNIYAGGARLDYDERYKDIPGVPES